MVSTESAAKQSNSARSGGAKAAKYLKTAVAYVPECPTLICILVRAMKLVFPNF